MHLPVVIYKIIGCKESEEANTSYLNFNVLPFL